MRTKKLLTAALGLSLLMASSAFGAIIVTESTDGTYNFWYFNNDQVTGGDAATDLQAAVWCEIGACDVVVYDDLGNSNPVTEVALLNSVIEPDVVAGDYSQFQWGGGLGSTYTTAEQYVMFKFGDAVDVWFENLTQGSITFFFDTSGPTYTGGGLSHVTNTVPAPGILALLGFGLAGIGLARRKKR